MADSRSKNAKRNIIGAMLNRIVTLLAQFFRRTVFIYCLGELYLGLNSLFSSTLNFLSLAELGIGGAMIFSMYKPIAEGDDNMVCALLNLYRRIYRLVGASILIIGLFLMLFLPYLIKGEMPDDVNLYVLYSMFLANTVLSYFLYAYKGSILTASQRSDIASNIGSIISIISSICQIIVLYLFKDYYIYNVVLIIFTVISNLVINHVVNKRYPQYTCRGKLNSETLTDIKKRVAGLFVYKVCYVFRDMLDAVFISAFIGLSVLGKYNNYMFILNTLTGILIIVRTNITASIGNSLATESEHKNHDDFNKIQILYMWISIWCTVCLFCLLQPFIKLWVGQNYCLGYIELTLFCLHFLCLKLGDVCSTYRQAAGLWWQDRYRPIVEAMVKTILNLSIIRYFGVAGALGGSIVCLLFINSIWASWVLYRYYFKQHSQWEYIRRNLFYLAISVVLCATVGWMCSFIADAGILMFATKCIICLVIPNILLWFILHVLPEYKGSMIMVRNLVRA